jgi:hypothetical protein
MEEYKLSEIENHEVSNLGNVRNIKLNRTLTLRYNADGYNIVKINNKNVLVHRLTAKAFIPNPENKPIVDHIDGDRTNNNISNLRWATYSENGMNKGLQSNNVSGKSGVQYNKRSNKWKVSININKRNIYIGSYKTFDEAKFERNRQERIHYGEFRRLQQEIDEKEFERLELELLDKELTELMR